jgi:hypothetical protein
MCSISVGRLAEVLVMQVTESDAIDLVELALKRHTTDITTRAMCLVSLLKLSSRFPPTSEYVRPFNHCN